MYNSTIKPKTGQCLDCPPGSENYLTAKRCEHHYRIHRALVNAEKNKDKPKKVQKEIPKYSAKQLDNLKKYRKVRDEFMVNKTCEAKLKGCTIKATDLHHAKGKIGDLLTDKRYFKALCRSCHSYIEVHPEFAKENGYSLNRL